MNERDVVAYLDELLDTHNSPNSFLYLRESLKLLKNQLERQAARKERKKEDAESI